MAITYRDAAGATVTLLSVNVAGTETPGHHIADPTTPAQKLAVDSSGRIGIGAVIPGGGATNLGKAEDAGHTSGDTGVMALAVRNDAGTVLAGTDLDYVPLTTDSSGALRVTSGGGGGGTQYTEDVASVGAESLTLAGSVRRDTAASSAGTTGDYATINTDATGNLWVNGSGVTQPTSMADGGSVSIGAKADSAATTDTGTFTLIALFKRLLSTYFAAGLKMLAMQGAANLSNSQVNVTTSAATLAIARATRRSLTIKNTDATNPIYVGVATVTTANGMPIKAGESITVTWVGLVQAISTGGTVVTALWDEYD